MKPLKDYVEIIFAVLALAALVFAFWYFLVAVPAKHAEQSGTFCDGSGGGSSSPERECHRDLKDT